MNSLFFLASLSPLNQALIFLVFLSICFLILVIFLDENENFALKRDWRNKN